MENESIIKPASIKRIPDDINAEILFSCFPEGKLKVQFDGTHHRNAYHDIKGLLAQDDVKKPLTLLLGRSSLYHILPEMMFHPFNRFTTENKEQFEEKYRTETKEKENALEFFAPVDLALFKIRLLVREKIQEYLESDKVLISLLSEGLSEKEKQNRFVQKTLPFLPACKYIRGDKTLMTLMLRKVLMDETIEIKVHQETMMFSDEHPRYSGSVGDQLDSFYLGNSYAEDVSVYEVHYWNEEECNQHFPKFIDDMETYRQFIQDHFMAVEDVFRFDISTDADGFYLSDETTYSYLNYNTNL